MFYQRTSLFQTAKATSVIVAAAFFINGMPVGMADQLEALPPAPPDSPSVAAAQNNSQNSNSAQTDNTTSVPAPPTPSTASVGDTGSLQRIYSDVPSYTDRGVAMVPLRAIAEFAGYRISSHENIVSLTKFPAIDPNDPAAVTSPPPTGTGDLTISLRIGSAVAQVQNAGNQSLLNMPLPVESRLGTVFVPLRSLLNLFGGQIEHLAENDINVITIDGRRGYLSAIAQEGYRGSDAARLTIVNGTGRALSLRLNGPQKFAIELGRSETITRSVKPGVYYYKAAAVGLKTHGGVRRLLAGRKATWSWGRR